MLSSLSKYCWRIDFFIEIDWDSKNSMFVPSRNVEGSPNPIKSSLVCSETTLRSTSSTILLYELSISDYFSSSSMIFMLFLFPFFNFHEGFSFMILL